MTRVVLPLLGLALTIYAVIDCIQTDQEAQRNLPKLAWVVLILLFPPIGAIAWFVAGRPRRGYGDRGRGPGRPGTPLGPDHDPHFLRNL
ncbi:PLDc N-terminal domain-containing protein [Oryzihumus sp.]